MMAARTPAGRALQRRRYERILHPFVWNLWFTDPIYVKMLHQTAGVMQAYRVDHEVVVVPDLPILRARAFR
jgi:hypothetical protein